MTPAQDRKLSPPPVNPETKPFWEACADGKLLIGRCAACGEAHYYPRALCPFCFSDTVLEQASGEGTIYTFSVMRRSPTGAYAIGYVTLDEGPAVLTNFVDCDLDALAIGQRVRLTFKPTDGGPPAPMFAPV